MKASYRILFIIIALVNTPISQSADGLETGSSFFSELLVQLDGSLTNEHLENELAVGQFLFRYLSESNVDVLTDEMAEDYLKTTDARKLLPGALFDLGMNGFAIAMLSHEAYEKIDDIGEVWLKLADEAAQRGRWREANRLALKVNQGKGVSENEFQRALYLRVSSYAHENLIDIAESILAEMDTSHSDHIFARFNLMLAYMRQGIGSDELIRYVNNTPFSLVKAELGEVEWNSLKDRFYMAAGKYELDNGRYAEAIRYLRGVSKVGAYADEGLLQYGWALAKQWQFDQALQPWRALQSSFPLTNLNVLESLMATAHVVELKKGGVPSIPIYEYSESKLASALSKISELNNEQVISSWIDSWEKPDIKSTDDWIRPESNALAENGVSIALEQLLRTKAFAVEKQRLMDIYAMAAWARDTSVRLKELNIQQQERGTATLAEIERVEKVLLDLRSEESLTKNENENSFVFAFLGEAESADTSAEIEKQVWYLDELSNHHIALPLRVRKVRELRVKLNELSIELVKLRKEQKSKILELSTGYLVSVEDQLKWYLSTTRLAIARLYDREFRKTNLVEGLNENE